MQHHHILSLACVSLVMLWGHGCAMHVPRVYSISMDTGSGNGEPDLLIPVDNPPVNIPPVNVAPSDVTPANVTTLDDTPFSPTTTTTVAPTLVGTISNTITTTMIRLKDFMLTRVVDFLQDNMLIITVVTSLLIVMIFIICCAATMSQKRKMEADKPVGEPPGKNHPAGGAKPSTGVHSRVYGGADSARRVQNQGTPKNTRTPSAALVGDKLGKEPKQKEVTKVKEEEEEPRRVEPKNKGLKCEEVQQNSSSSHPMVCTCHLRKANH
ncbi:hypothetical protein DPEC_G00120270 [Dallia pectoralis]|uniref:Uncharacterized protein n=1 Tax=Dallia pectoralis TaxID=75939 RepID=A0ACC2GQD1_DALPE|nr:hypothetical protein DPEC_G00120270 [Dallia pectoralis]